MYSMFDTQTTLTLARLHQDDVRAAYPRRRPFTWLRRRSGEPPVAPSRMLAPPAPGATHHPAAA